MMRFLFIAGLALSLTACSTIKGWFSGDPKPGDPAELVEFVPTADTDKVWSRDVGKGTDKRMQQLRPAYRGGTFWIADYKGRLSSVDAASGTVNWELKTELPFSGGPGLSESLVIMGTENGEIHAFQADTGTPLWIARVSSEVLAAPAALPIDRWSHVMMVYWQDESANKGFRELYINGLLAVSDSFNKSDHNGGNWPLQGNEGARLGHLFSGRIDEVRIFREPLSSSRARTRPATPPAAHSSRDSRARERATDPAP